MEKAEKKARVEVDEEELRAFLRIGPTEPLTGGNRAREPPLHKAASAGRDDYVRHLVKEEGENVDVRGRTGETALGWAVWEKHMSTARLLLELGANINLGVDDCGTALWLAMQNGDRPMIRMLIDHGAKLTPAERINIDSKIIDFVHNLLMEKLFFTVVTGGILSNGTEFRDFLADGVCDARLLIHVAKFAYSSD